MFVASVIAPPVTDEYRMIPPFVPARLPTDQPVSDESTVTFVFARLMFCRAPVGSANKPSDFPTESFEWIVQLMIRWRRLSKVPKNVLTGEPRYCPSDKAS